MEIITHHQNQDIGGPTLSTIISSSALEKNPVSEETAKILSVFVNLATMEYFVPTVIQDFSRVVRGNAMYVQACSSIFYSLR